MFLKGFYHTRLYLIYNFYMAPQTLNCFRVYLVTSSCNQNPYIHMLLSIVLNPVREALFSLTVSMDVEDWLRPSWWCHWKIKAVTNCSPLLRNLWDLRSCVSGPMASESLRERTSLRGKRELETCGLY